MPMPKYLLFTAIAACSATTASIMPASAAEPGPGAPIGVRMPMSMTLYPSIEAGALYDSNIFRQSQLEDSDLITTVSPKLKATSDWAVHALTLSASGDFGYYNDNGSEDYEDYMLSAKGRLDIVHDTYLTGTLSHKHQHEFRENPNNSSGSSPAEYDLNTIGIGFTREFGRIKLYAETERLEWSYDAGTGFNSTTQDRTENKHKVKLAYEMKPGRDVYVQYGVVDREFDNPASSGSNSKADEILFGLALSPTRTLETDLYAGYYNHEYDTGGSSVDYVNFGGSLNWSITPITAFKATIGKEILPSVDPVNTDYITTKLLFQLSHALRNNVQLHAQIELIENEFIDAQGNETGNNEVHSGKIGAEYYLSRGFSLLGAFEHRTRDSTAANEDFSADIASLTLQYAF